MNLFAQTTATVILPLLLLVSLFCYINVSLAQNCKSQISRTIIVDQSGKSKFKTVQSAIDSIPENNNQWVKIHINAGTYKEKVHIPCQKPCIFLEGEGIDVTTITYNDHQSTDESATFSSSPDNVVASKITFKNSFDVGKMLSLQEIKDGNDVVPALSARIYGDKSGFYDCRFVGYQDTLWDVEGRHYYKNCIIEGAVDFIFGSGQSYFEDCVINATSPGFITAQGRESDNDPSGFVFKGGSVVGSNPASSFLGRAYGPYSRVIFYGTNLGSVVHPKGWHSWHFATHEDKFTYGEVNCKGAGANLSKRVPWEKKLVATQLNQFSRSSFVDHDNWILQQQTSLTIGET
ncbi:putative pectinesterase 52 [Arachis hypogaea]|uniref:Pectinesterase n=1 Tax=Arachis hypogaea TaxID=3818 RepID=A0A445DMP7_ARAHY|nr:Putative pectinesterase [Arachis hypogaea]RYR64448.1 hypothetical protein Ahy_A03g010556 [Arachis hypogaea]